MTISCDTNIVMEFLQQRTFASQVEKILTQALQIGDDMDKPEYNVGDYYTWDCNSLKNV